MNNDLTKQDYPNFKGFLAAYKAELLKEFFGSRDLLMNTLSNTGVLATDQRVYGYSPAYIKPLRQSNTPIFALNNFEYKGICEDWARRQALAHMQAMALVNKANEEIIKRLMMLNTGLGGSRGIISSDSMTQGFAISAIQKMIDQDYPPERLVALIGHDQWSDMMAIPSFSMAVAGQIGLEPGSSYYINRVRWCGVLWCLIGSLPLDDDGYRNCVMYENTNLACYVVADSVVITAGYRERFNTDGLASSMTIKMSYFCSQGSIVFRVKEQKA